MILNQKINYVKEAAITLIYDIAALFAVGITLLYILLSKNKYSKDEKEIR